MSEGDNLLMALKKHRAEAHARLFSVLEDLDDEAFAWQPAPNLPSIAFHVWHLGRWADLDREAVGGGSQIWTGEGLARAWGLSASELGIAETGMGMGDDMTPALARLDRHRILDYARRALAALDEYVTGIAASDLASMSPSPSGGERAAGALLMSHFAHDNRHLGMIEALRGMQGLRGTATD